MRNDLAGIWRGVRVGAISAEFRFIAHYDRRGVVNGRAGFVAQRREADVCKVTDSLRGLLLMSLEVDVEISFGLDLLARRIPRWNKQGSLD